MKILINGELVDASPDQAAEIAAYREEASRTVPVSSIHVAWLRAALAEAGKLAAVDAAVSSQGDVKKALWDFATSISKADADVVAIAAALKLDLDALFNRAEEIRKERA